MLATNPPAIAGKPALSMILVAVVEGYSSQNPALWKRTFSDWGIT